MNKQRKTSHILNVFQYDHTTGAVTLPSSLSLTSPDSTDNSTKVATTAWIRAYVGSLSYATASSVETAIANLIASAPTTLNTLNELATALGNDPNFATTITTSIGNKLSLTGGTLTGDLTLSGINPRLYFTDTDNNPDYFISNTDGTFTVYDVTNSVGRFKIYTTGHAEFTNNLTAASFVKSGGTAAQFLKADGSVDGNTYLTGITSSQVTTALGYTPVTNARTITINGTAYDLSADRSWSIAAGVTSFNTRTGAITLSSTDVTTALGYTPYNNTNPSGYITGITSANVTTALGYTPYNSTNPSGYITSSGTAAAVSQTVGAGSEANLVYSTIADNDFFRIRVGGSSNAGWVEIATADDGTEPIYVRQYTGVFSTVTRTATLLDGSGNTSFPGNISGGYILGSYFNSSAGNSENPTIGQIWTQSTGDNYLRKSTPSHFINQLGLITTSNIGSQSVNYSGYSGYSNLVSIPDWRDTNYQPNQFDGHRVGFHFNNTSALGGNSDFWMAVQTVSPWSSYDPSHRQQQMMWGGSGGLSFRYATSTTAWSGWQRIMTSDNSTYAWNMNQYVRTTDSPSFVNVYASSDVRGTDVYTTGGWFRNHTNNAGIYWSNTGWHIYPQGSSDMGMLSGGSSAAMQMMTSGGTTRGYFYVNDSNQIGILTNDGNWGLRVNSNKETNLHGNLVVNYGGNSSSIYMTDGDEGTREIHCNSNRIGFLTQAGSWGSWCDDSGNWYAPTFYDSNNGGYYLDPDSTSNLLNIQMPHRGNGTPNLLVNNGGSENWGAIHIGGGSGNLRIGKSDAGRSWSGRVSLAMHVGAAESFRVHSDGWDSLFEVWGSSGYGKLKGTFEALGDIYCNTLNTGNYINIGYTRNGESVATTAFRGIDFHTLGDFNYYIGKPAGAWTQPLHIHFYTGIRLRSHSSYGGTQFYNISGGVTTATINDGDNHLRGYYDIIAYASDKRLKHKVEPIKQAVNKVLSLTGMTYQWNQVGNLHGWSPDTQTREVGVFAQDVQAVLPEAVKLAPFDTENGISKSGENFLTVKYEKLTPLLIEAIKEQQTQIESQQSEIAELKDLVKQLLAK